MVCGYISAYGIMHCTTHGEVLLKYLHPDDTLFRNFPAYFNKSHILQLSFMVKGGEYKTGLRAEIQEKHQTVEQLKIYNNRELGRITLLVLQQCVC